MSALKFVNMVFCQWFFFRITRAYNLLNGNYVVVAWGLIFVLPLTGWGNGYKPKNPKFHQLWKTDNWEKVRKSA